MPTLLEKKKKKTIFKILKQKNHAFQGLITS